jgi:hypothetical protein
MNDTQTRLLDMLTDAELLLRRRAQHQISKGAYARARDEKWHEISGYRAEMVAAGMARALPKGELIAEFRALSRISLRSDESALMRRRAIVGELHREYPGWDADMSSIMRDSPAPLP